MKKIVFTLFTGLLLTTAFAQSKNFIDQPYVETTASVDTLVVPDRLYLNIVLRETDTKNRQSVEELENRMEKTLSSLGIDTSKQLMLADLSTNYKDYFLRRTGVVKSKAYTLLVYDALTAGRVIQELESVNIANVSFWKAEVSKLEAVKLELRKKAVTAARMQAKALLEPLGQNLGKAIHISDMNTGIAYGWRNRGQMDVMMSKAEQAEPLDVDFQKVKVNSSVNIKFAVD